MQAVDFVARMKSGRTINDTRERVTQGTGATPLTNSSPKLLTAAVVALCLIAAAHVGDVYLWEHWRDPRVNDRDWGRMLRTMGYGPLWLVIAAGYWFHDAGANMARWKWRGAFVFLAPVMSGVLAELGKILVRRLRPDPEHFGYAFRAISEDFLSTRGLGMPSSHVAVAFAGAVVMSRLVPRGWPLWYLLAAGCAATRILALGHFLSDTVVAAVLAWFSTELLWRKMQKGQE